jgi:type IV pilus assembly protein PilB
MPRKALGQALKDMGLVTEPQIQDALRIQREKGGRLGGILVELGLVSPEEVLLGLSAQEGMEVVDLDDA